MNKRHYAEILKVLFIRNLNQTEAWTRNLENALNGSFTFDLEHWSMTGFHFKLYPSHLAFVFLPNQLLSRSWFYFCTAFKNSNSRPKCRKKSEMKHIKQTEINADYEAYKSTTNHRKEAAEFTSGGKLRRSSVKVSLSNKTIITFASSDTFYHRMHLLCFLCYALFVVPSMNLREFVQVSITAAQVHPVSGMAGTTSRGKKKTCHLPTAYKAIKELGVSNRPP